MNDRGGKRSSTRTVVISKAMKIVDSDTRIEVKDKRLRTLEADNYNMDVQVVEDEDYSDESGNESPGGKKRKSKSSSKTSAKTSKTCNRKLRDFDRLMDHAQYNTSKEQSSNVVSTISAPSTLPARKFCSVCGYWGNYSCTRCGMRFCSVRCNVQHKETRCIKFGTF